MSGPRAVGQGPRARRLIATPAGYLNGYLPELPYTILRSLLAATEVLVVSQQCKFRR